MNWIIIVALLGVWGDVFLSNATGLIFGPVALFMGIIYYIQRQKTFERILWILSFGAWGLFVASGVQIALQTIIFLVASEGLNILFARLIPRENRWLRIVTASVISSVALMVFSIFALKYFGFQLLPPIIALIIVSTFFVQYVQKKEK